MVFLLREALSWRVVFVIGHCLFFGGGRGGMLTLAGVVCGNILSTSNWPICFVLGEVRTLVRIAGRVQNRVDRRRSTCGKNNNTTAMNSVIPFFFVLTLCLPLPRAPIKRLPRGFYLSDFTQIIWVKKSNTTPVNSLRVSRRGCSNRFCSYTLPPFATDTYKLVALGSLFIWVYSDYLSFSI